MLGAPMSEATTQPPADAPEQTTSSEYPCIRRMSVEVLVDHQLPDNPRVISALEFEQLKRQLDDLGNLQPITYNVRTSHVISGNQRADGYLELGIKEVDVWCVDLPEEQERKAVLALNNHAGRYDDAMLKGILEQIAEDAATAGEDKDLAFSATGFTAEELERIFAEAQSQGPPPPNPQVEARATLSDRFLIPPFSVLDARQGYWQTRKNAWIALGLKGEEGRGGNLIGRSPQELFMFNTRIPYDEARKIVMAEMNDKGDAFDLMALIARYSPGHADAGPVPGGAGKTSAWLGKDAKGKGKQAARTFGQDLMRGEHVVGGTRGGLQFAAKEAEAGDPAEANNYSGTSIFDPVLCEVAYYWFCPPFLCSNCEAKALSGHGNKLRPLPAPVRDSEKSEGAEEVLQQGMSEIGTSEAPPTLRLVPEADSLSEGERRQQALQPGVRGGSSQGQTSEPDGGHSDRQGIPTTLQAGASDGGEERLRAGASAGHGGMAGADASAGGSRSPQERNQDGQSTRKPSATSEISARPNSKAAPQADQMPPLRRDDRSLGTCQICKADLTKPGATRPSTILDPFSGGSTRGAVAGCTGHAYTGVDLSDRQIAANRQQWPAISEAARGIVPGAEQKLSVVPEPVAPHWVQGDSTNMAELTGSEEGTYDMVFSCHPAATMVHSDRGLVPIETIEAGDRVLTHRGRELRVTETFVFAHTGKLFRFHRDFRNLPLEATPEHPLLVSRCGATNWMRASAIIAGDFLLEPVPEYPLRPIDNEPVWNWERPDRLSNRGIEARGYKTVHATKEAARLLGYYLAEGSISGDMTQFAFHEEEKHLTSDVQKLFSTVFGGDLKTKVRQQGEGSRGVVVTCCGLIAARFFSETGRGAHKKRIPSWVWKCSNEVVAELIKGAWAGDGWVEATGKLGYATVSEQLADDIRRLLLRFGIIAAIRRRERIKTNYGPARTQWGLVVRGSSATLLAEMLGETVRIPPHRRPGRGPFISGGFVHYRIRRVEAIQVENLPVFNIEVASDHSYLADGIVSHNCPPYADLEVYSDHPADISNMPYDKFLPSYRQIIAESVKLLKPNRFACFVVGHLRDEKGFYRNFVADTIHAFEDAGARLYNEAILVTAIGSLPIRVGRQFAGYRKLGKTHQNLLIFFKGDPQTIKEWPAHAGQAITPEVVDELTGGTEADDAAAKLAMEALGAGHPEDSSSPPQPEE
jgi:intein/homing endonuclease